MENVLYFLDRIEGDGEYKSAVFISETHSPRVLIIPYANAEALSDGSLRENTLCRLSFSDDGAVSRIFPDPEKTEAVRRENSSRLHSLFDRNKNN